MTFPTDPPENEIQPSAAEPQPAEVSQSDPDVHPPEEESQSIQDVDQPSSEPHSTPDDAVGPEAEAPQPAGDPAAPAVTQPAASDEAATLAAASSSAQTAGQVATTICPVCQYRFVPGVPVR